MSYLSEYELEEEIRKVKEDYRPDVERQIQRINDYIERLGAYKMALRCRKAYLGALPYGCEITLTRNSYSSNGKIYFEVRLYEGLMEEGQLKGTSQTFFKQFPGTARNEAVRLARQMSREHQCKVRLEGFWHKTHEKMVEQMKKALDVEE